ncbi:MAG: serine/threonine protein kinase, partial [Actinomycetota bacterium]|nr:serine/threonine protein kinase [Actinomycetota bacterium]
MESAAEMVGELILGRFRVTEAIGSGGFGTVYRAWDERLQRPVAVKVIDGQEGTPPRVMREAQAVARLAHRNIATLYELAHEGERAYLVSELIDGETLRALGRRGELSDRLVAEVGADSAAALSHAHRNGVVHRDVKPENVLVAAGGEAKLVDFGIARIAGERTLTGTGDVLGTLAYMAPEQADGQRAGPAADVYSLALTLYECLCGEHPLLRDGAAATARAIGEPIAQLAAVRPDLPPQLTETIDVALDPDPEVRPLASELEASLCAQAAELDGEPLPPVLRPSDPEPAPGRRAAALGLLRFAPAASIALLTFVVLAALGSAPA